MMRSLILHQCPSYLNAFFRIHKYLYERMKHKYTNTYARTYERIHTRREMLWNKAARSHKLPTRFKHVLQFE